jgi:hypothetical protein
MIPTPWRVRSQLNFFRHLIGCGVFPNETKGALAKKGTYKGFTLNAAIFATPGMLAPRRFAVTRFNTL